MKVGVFIPCAIWHQHHLPALIRNLSDGEPPPDRVAVVISGGVPSRDAVDAVCGCNLACFDELVSCGDAKNMAHAMLHDCDVIAYHDADDLMTPDRIDVIRGVFSNSGVKALNHSYVYRMDEPVDTTLTTVAGDYPYASLDDGLSQPAFGGHCGFRVHAGAVCVRRDVLKVVRWEKSEKRDEDRVFCTKLLYVLGNRHLITNHQIYVYNHPNHENRLR
jgi:hypothetical protein